MHILVGLILGLVLLYLWLVGWWFARIIVFLVLACAGFAAGSVAINFGLYDGHADVWAPGMLAGAIGAALAWPLASIPIYYQRHKNRDAAYRSELRKRQLLSQELPAQQPLAQQVCREVFVERPTPPPPRPARSVPFPGPWIRGDFRAWDREGLWMTAYGLAIALGIPAIGYLIAGHSGFEGRS